MARTLSVKMAKAIAAQIDGLDRLLVDIADHLPDVREEVAKLHMLRAANQEYHAKRALLFALASPQLNFDKNVIAARRLHAGLDSFADVEGVYQALAADRNGTVTSGSTARSIFHSLPFLRNIRDYNVAELRDAQQQRTIMGAGPKVSAMAAHLFDPSDAAFTLDTHMLRGIVDTILGIRDTWTIGNSAYRILESALIDWAVSRYPDDDVFTIQWAMWSVFRGSFDSHIAIFNG